VNGGDHSKGKLAGAGVAAGLCLVVLIIICGAFFGYKGREGGQPLPTPSVDSQMVDDLPDCDADDRSPNWDVKDCGPSPKPVKTRGPAPRPTKRK
jgi:hypothetical protein